MPKYLTLKASFIGVLFPLIGIGISEIRESAVEQFAERVEAQVKISVEKEKAKIDDRHQHKLNLLYGELLQSTAEGRQR